MQKAPRKFGVIPDWAETGPITLRNYDYRAEAHCAQRSKLQGHGQHPTITRQSKAFHEWCEYFRRHLGDEPVAFRKLLDGSIAAMTVPEELPTWFDASFEATPGYVVEWPKIKDDPEIRARTIAVIKRCMDELRMHGFQFKGDRAPPSATPPPTPEEIAAKWAAKGPPKASPQLDAILKGKR